MLMKTRITVAMMAAALGCSAVLLAHQAAAPAAGERPAANAAQVAEWMKTSSTWGKWGPDDQLGAVNYITPEKRRNAAALVRTGETVSLQRPISLVQRHAEIAADGRPNGVSFYEMTFRTFPKGDPRGNEDFSSDVQSFAPHGAGITHLDALCHYRDRKSTR